MVMEEHSHWNIRHIKAEHSSWKYILTFHLSKKSKEINEMIVDKNFALEISYKLQNYDKNG